MPIRKKIGIPKNSKKKAAKTMVKRILRLGTTELTNFKKGRKYRLKEVDINGGYKMFCKVNQYLNTIKVEVLISVLTYSTVIAHNNGFANQCI